jgi:hypothetical protein
MQRRWLFLTLLATAGACTVKLPLAQAADTPPDLSGVWTWYIEPGQRRVTTTGGPGADLPYTPQAREKVQAYRALVAPTGDNPGAHCLGSGMPESLMFSGGYPMEIIQRPEQITIIYEAHSEIRRLYFGSKVIAPADRIPARNGYSVAHWEGDVLVVETTALKEQEDQGYPHGDQARIVERYHLTTDAKGSKVLQADWTLTDPEFYTKPVSATKKWALDPKGILLPYECDEETWLDHLEELKKGKTGAPGAAYK